MVFFPQVVQLQIWEMPICQKALEIVCSLPFTPSQAAWQVTSWELVLVLLATTMKNPPKFLPHNLVCCWLKYAQFGIVLTKICTEVSYFWCQGILSTQNKLNLTHHTVIAEYPKVDVFDYAAEIKLLQGPTLSIFRKLNLYSYLQGFFSFLELLIKK